MRFGESEQAQLAGSRNSIFATMHPQFPENALYLRLDGIDGYDVHISNVSIGEASYHEV